MNNNLEKKLRILKKSYLNKLEGVIAELEKLLHDAKNNIKEIYSNVHTISGTSGMYGLNKISEASTDFEFYLKELKKDVSTINEEEFKSKFSSYLFDMIILLEEENRPTVVIADDEEFVRDFLKSVLDSSFKIVAEVDKGDELPLILDKMQPEMLILDIHMPNLTGMEFLEQYASYFPKICVIILTSAISEELMAEVSKKGVRCFLRKDTPVDDMYIAIKQTWDKFTRESRG